MEHPTQSTMLTPEQVAAHLQVSRDTVLRLINKGKIRAIKVGGQWRIAEEWLEEFKRKQTNTQ